MKSGIQEMETMILECAKLDREINYFVDAVQQVMAEVNALCPGLVIQVENKFSCVTN